MKYPLVRDLAADGIPVTVACRVLGFSPQGFNKWRRNPISQREWDDAHLTDLARDIHHDDPTFGYRFVYDEIADQGVRASERRVWRICSEQRLWSLHAKKRGLTRKAGPPVHDDLVLRQFRVAGLAAGILIRRFRSSRVAIAATIVASLGIVVAGMGSTWAVVAGGLFIAGAMDSITDVAQNSHGLRVQKLYGRSILNSFHAIWSIGAVTGGALGAWAA